MADPVDVHNMKLCRKDFMKHKIDVTQADIRVNHGIVYIRGLIRQFKGAEYEDLEIETKRIARLFRQRPGIRDVIVEATYR